MRSKSRPGTKKYRTDTVYILGFGKYKDKSLSQIPLQNWNAYWYLKEGNYREFLAANDVEKIDHVVKAFQEFPVLIKCCGKYGDCKENAAKLAIPWEKRISDYHKADKGRRVQFELGSNPFFCAPCYEDFAHQHSDGSRGLGVRSFPISFEIFTDKNGHADWNLNRSQIHGLFRRIAFQLNGRDIHDVIDVTKIDPEQRPVFNRENAKNVVNKLMSVDDLFGFEPSTISEYNTSIIYTNSQKAKFFRKKKEPIDPGLF